MKDVCETCGRGPFVGGVTLFRANPLGQLPAVWRCREHRDDISDEDDSDDIVRIIEHDNRKHRRHGHE